MCCVFELACEGCCEWCCEGKRERGETQRQRRTRISSLTLPEPAPSTRVNQHPLAAPAISTRYQQPLSAPAISTRSQHPCHPAPALNTRSQHPLAAQVSPSTRSQHPLAAPMSPSTRYQHPLAALVSPNTRSQHPLAAPARNTRITQHPLAAPARSTGVTQHPLAAPASSTRVTPSPAPSTLERSNVHRYLPRIVQCQSLPSPDITNDRTMRSNNSNIMLCTYVCTRARTRAYHLPAPDSCLRLHPYLRLHQWSKR
ncbi:uncharacterized protein LAJ45_11539 [Morchella importuna]|uniref:uncharacterized protein n=1 Tax=Morchella importuna TaxID=1174673 RepID=UPI001E8DA95E|nr:uncharacterized protein LAJ45_11539 [Morchella importuna]KAH8144474.1 hypothetical protein LAJ45_11539 [Morchella importuna]